VINCIGLIKQQKRAKEALPSIDLNARFRTRWPGCARRRARA
jgi:hypothetical protein